MVISDLVGSDFGRDLLICIFFKIKDHNNCFCKAATSLQLKEGCDIKELL